MFAASWNGVILKKNYALSVGIIVIFRIPNGYSTASNIILPAG